LNKAEERYRALEAKSLLEVDRERQRAITLGKDLVKSADALREQQRLHMKELAAAQKVNANQREKLGMISGQLVQLKQLQKETTKKLSIAERTLEQCKRRTGFR
jgi:hypothetical protein